MIYLSGGGNAAIRQAATVYPIGILVTPARWYIHQVEHYRWWAADNDCFHHGDTFNLKSYLDWLERYHRHFPTCLFATAPDVVGDASATLARSAEALPRIRALGIPAALVAQDGLERLPVPWSAFDALFIGGTTEWKLGASVRALVAEATSRGKHIHMGRVNSGKRLRYAHQIGCDSADGTQLVFQPRRYLPRLQRYLGEIAWQQILWAS